MACKKCSLIELHKSEANGVRRMQENTSCSQGHPIAGSDVVHMTVYVMSHRLYRGRDIIVSVAVLAACLPGVAVVVESCSAA